MRRGYNLSKGMKNIILLIILVSCFNSCQKKTMQSDNIIVEVQKIKGGGPFSKLLSPLKLLDTVPQYIKGIPILDSFRLSTLSNYKYSKNAFNQKKLRNDIFALTGYLNENQIVITDVNNNFDFSDDTIVYLAKDFKFYANSNKGIRDSLKLISIPYQRYENEKLYTDTVNLKMLPYYGYSAPIRDSINENYKLVAEINEYWVGKFVFNKSSYNLALNENSIFGENFLIGKSIEEFNNSKNGTLLSYSIKDTIKLDNDLLTVKEISYKKREIIFKILDKKNSVIGYREGDKFANIEFQDILNGENYNTDSLLKKKDFLLIDFWGTWCQPCMELTPDLIEMQKKYYSKLNILSFAYDKNKSDVLNYINKNKMNWTHSYIKGNAKDKTSQPKIIENLRIRAYPTFILIDSQGLIVLRGSGKSILEQIEERLQK